MLFTGQTNQREEHGELAFDVLELRGLVLFVERPRRVLQLGAIAISEESEFVK